MEASAPDGCQPQASPGRGPRTVWIDPVTRIEGHARISLRLDGRGRLVDARFHVLEFRGFEAFCVGRPFREMPGLTARICGICPVSHLLASACTGDQLLAVNVPPAAVLLRRVLNLAQILQSHALSFFHLSSPDLLLGAQVPPSQRSIVGLIAADPALAQAGIRLRGFGQSIIEHLAGRPLHAAWVVPGGVRTPLPAATRDRILAGLPEARRTVALALERFKVQLDGPLAVEQHRMGWFPSLFLAMVAADGTWEHLGGALQVVDAAGAVLADGLDGAAALRLLGEAVEPWTYLKFPYYRPMGYPDGLYRVGPLARLNVCDRIGTAWADRELVEFRQRYGRVALSSFGYHLARLVELVACLEGIERLLADPVVLDPLVQARAGLNARSAVGMGEAPRGTLFHHYQVDGNGLLEQMNLLIATGQNNLAMNRTIAQLARALLPDPVPADAEIPEPLLNRIEAGIRCFDPCLSCSTHAAGSMPLHLRLIAADGRVLAERQRP